MTLQQPTLTPHGMITALDPPGSPNRRWKCDYCGLQGSFDYVQALDCNYTYPPCDTCGGTPECEADCAAMAALLSDPRVYVAGAIPITQLACPKCHSTDIRGTGYSSGRRCISCKHLFQVMVPVI